VSPLVERTVARSRPLETSDGAVLGLVHHYQRIIDQNAYSGRLLSVLDVDRNARVCVIGAEVSAEFFGDSSPVGAVMRLMGDPYTVVGVLVARPSVGTAGGTLSPRDLNQAVLVPVTHSSFFGQQPLVSEVWLRMAPEVSPDEGGAVAARALGAVHAAGTPFELLVPRELLAQRMRTRRTFNIVLGSVAALSLLVAGIGIMNMMLANVLERTTEIGLRRTVGATRRSIAVQFLLESVLVAAAGGVAGVVVGSLASTVVSRYAAWPTHVSVWAVVVSLAVAGAVGVVFGTVPARRAASLEPVDAVRYE
jgi:putative ABC transport system permease protein